MAKKEGLYTVYVFEEVTSRKYIMCTKLPNWQTPIININDIGFLQYAIVKAGDSYFNKNTGLMQLYSYNGIYFINFIVESHIIDNKIIL